MTKEELERLGRQLAETMINLCIENKIKFDAMITVWPEEAKGVGISISLNIKSPQ